MKKILPITFLLFFFLLFKYFNLDIRLSDTNIYFYTGFQILNGKILYKDIFFTNFPLLPYISALYYILAGKSLKLFYFTSSIEITVITSFIFYLVYKKTKDAYIAFLSSIVYIFSFLILSTSDHQTGVFTASLFSVISYFFLERKKFFTAGFLIGCSFLTKAYFLPIVLTFFFFVLYKRNIQHITHFIIGILCASFLILLPTFLFAHNQFFVDVFSYSLTRSQGVSKKELVWFFITHDILLFIILLFNLFNKKNIFFVFISFFSILFFLGYQDIYYLYLNFFAPFLAISLPAFYDYFKSHFSSHLFIFPTIVSFILILNLIIYLSSYQTIQKFPDINSAVNSIKKERPSFIFGVNDITPALAFLSQTPLLNNIIDTNPNLFRKKFLDAKTLTKEAIAKHSIIVAHGVYYPQAGINQEIFDEIFDTQQIEKSCKLIKSIPIYAEGIANRINLLKCY